MATPKLAQALPQRRVLVLARSAPAPIRAAPRPARARRAGRAAPPPTRRRPGTRRRPSQTCKPSKSAGDVRRPSRAALRIRLGRPAALNSSRTKGATPDVGQCHQPRRLLVAAPAQPHEARQLPAGAVVGVVASTRRVPRHRSAAAISSRHALAQLAQQPPVGAPAQVAQRHRDHRGARGRAPGRSRRRWAPAARRARPRAPARPVRARPRTRSWPAGRLARAGAPAAGARRGAGVRSRRACGRTARTTARSPASAQHRVGERELEGVEHHRHHRLPGSAAARLRGGQGAATGPGRRPRPRSGTRGASTATTPGERSRSWPWSCRMKPSTRRGTSSSAIGSAMRGTLPATAAPRLAPRPLDHASPPRAPMFDLFRRLARTGAAYQAGEAVAKVIAVALLPVYTRYLTPRRLRHRRPAADAGDPGVARDPPRPGGGVRALLLRRRRPRASAIAWPARPPAWC